MILRAAVPLHRRPARVYFNVVTMVGWTGAGGGAANPNLGVLPARMEVVGLETHEAILGVWIDCNGDGYIGMVEPLLREYAASLLEDASRCPPTERIPWSGQHNHDGWVSELIPIANSQRGGGDARLFMDSEAAVWGDHGRPVPLPGACGQHPRDQLLRVADCLADAADPALAAGGVSLPRASPGEPKRAADWNFHFVTAPRGGVPAGLLASGGAGADGTVGLLHEGSRWVADSYAVKPAPRAVRGDLQVDEPPWYTFYARVGAATFDRGHEAPGAGAYGAEACGLAEQGERLGWDCDAEAWNAGAPVGERRVLARPGLMYHLRDVDCHDGEAHGMGVGLGLAGPFYGAWPCGSG